MTPAWIIVTWIVAIVTVAPMTYWLIKELLTDSDFRWGTGLYIMIMSAVGAVSLLIVFYAHEADKKEKADAGVPPPTQFEQCIRACLPTEKAEKQP